MLKSNSQPLNPSTERRLEAYDRWLAMPAAAGFTFEETFGSPEDDYARSQAPENATVPGDGDTNWDEFEAAILWFYS